jgi:hypothetical protein
MIDIISAYREWIFLEEYFSHSCILLVRYQALIEVWEISFELTSKLSIL